MIWKTRNGKWMFKCVSCRHKEKNFDTDTKATQAYLAHRDKKHP